MGESLARGEELSRAFTGQSRGSHAILASAELQDSEKERVVRIAHRKGGRKAGRKGRLKKLRK